MTKFMIEASECLSDALLRRRNAKELEQLPAEFEFKSSSFKSHKHDPQQCDLIIC